jgi:excisionase family DNA binding protein
METLLTVTEAADRAKVTASTIYRWINGNVLSIKYFPDGRQAIIPDELEKLTQSGQNAALVSLFHQVAQALGQAVVLLPDVERAFGSGWKGNVWPREQWEKVRIMAMSQSEAHRDIGPFMRKRGRPPKSI